jgi:hypothetical protein
MIHCQDFDDPKIACCGETVSEGDRLLDNEAFEAALDAEGDDCCVECVEIHL